MDRLSGALVAAVLIATFASPVGAAHAERAQLPGCDATAGTLDWGFKESFRAYIDGSIANGEWETSEGAVYETPRFGWRDGEGRLNPATTDGAVSFVGTVRFTGHDGILDTTIANPVVRFDGEGAATLLLDVSGATMEGEQVDETAVEFVVIDLSEADLTPVRDLITVIDAPTTLTEDGATAFPNYEPGVAFDPISFTLEVPDCLLEAPPRQSDLGWIVVIVVSVIAIAGAAVAAAVGIRRRSS